MPMGQTEASATFRDHHFPRLFSARLYAAHVAPVIHTPDLELLLLTEIDIRRLGKFVVVTIAAGDSVSFLKTYGTEHPTIKHLDQTGTFVAWTIGVRTFEAAGPLCSVRTSGGEKHRPARPQWPAQLGFKCFLHWQLGFICTTDISVECGRFICAQRVVKAVAVFSAIRLVSSPQCFYLAYFGGDFRKEFCVSVSRFRHVHLNGLLASAHDKLSPTLTELDGSVPHPHISHSSAPILRERALKRRREDSLHIRT